MAYSVWKYDVSTFSYNVCACGINMQNVWEVLMNGSVDKPSVTGNIGIDTNTYQRQASKSFWFSLITNQINHIAALLKMQEWLGWENQEIKSEMIGMKTLTTEMVMERLKTFSVIFEPYTILCVGVLLQSSAYTLSSRELVCITADIKHQTISMIQGRIQTR